MALPIRVGTAVLIGVLAGGAAMSGAAVAAPGVNCAEPGRGEITGSWPRALLRAGAAAPIADGSGVTVAVLSTGVDAGQPQLRGRVLTGVDTVDGVTPAREDCTGTGTQVAGVIAGQQAGGDDDVAGLAPKSRILPIRVQPDDPAGSRPTPDAVARGVAAAVENGAEVLVVAVPVYEDDPDLAAAVAGALAQDVVVVAAAGDRGSRDDGNPTPYPAAYNGVVGVGAIDQNGRIAAGSQRGAYVDLVAPGVAVPTLQTGRGLVEVDGTAVAAGFVGATAALIRDRRADLDARAVSRLLTATAGPAPIGPAFGAGVVDPPAALTGQLVRPSSKPLPGLQPVVLPDTTAESRRRTAALASTASAGGAVLAVLVVAAALRRSRRSGWRPVAAPPVRIHAEPTEPGPPVMLLDRPGKAPTP